MAKKARQRISYVLELAGSQSGGHRLGVNGLAVDRDNAILYSGGRDGIVCAWDLNLDLKKRDSSTVDPSPPDTGGGGSGGGANGTVAAKITKSSTQFRNQTLAHTHWINDIALAQNNTAVVSGSSDLLVKVWRPYSNQHQEPVTIGQHADYVKAVATPTQQTDWVATGGLDRKIYLWDLNGAGKKLEIDVSGEEMAEKGSVYALRVNHSILASGGPESTVRLWDPRTGKNITKFVGHTDNVRAILLNESGDTIMTASSDQTVKVWSVTAGRCMHTLTMHNDSVWSLYSDDPNLGVFYSSDRSGLVVKTDVRGTRNDMDDGLSLAVAQENEGVGKVVACSDWIWTTTSSSSINRWADVDTGADIQLPEAFKQHRASVSTVGGAAVNGTTKKEIPANSILRISNTASFPSKPLATDSTTLGGAQSLHRKGSELPAELEEMVVEPIHRLPEETIEGQFGLVKHRLLNDRRRVLTLDTAGDVLLWDLISCKPVEKYGKKHLEDVEPMVNTLEAVAPWCSIDTSSGNLTVVLEPYNCFDAEMYADQLVTEEPVEFREDQRINLGKWILRYLFANLIDVEIKRDEAHRAMLNEAVEKRIAAAKANPPSSIALPSRDLTDWEQAAGSPVTTPRANGTSLLPPVTPGIAVATPSASTALAGTAAEVATPLSATGKRSTQLSRPSVDKEDYFTNAISSIEAAQPKPATTPGPTASAATDKDAKTTNGEIKEKDKDNDKDKDKDKEKEKEKEKEKDKDKENTKTAGTAFGKKFRMGMSFGTKKIGRSASSTAPEKPAVVDEKVEEQSESSSNHEKEVDDCFLGVVQKVQHDYERQLAENPEKHVETRITPSLPNDTPVLKLPPGTKVIIQEETSGGSAELYRGTVETVGQDADIIEQKGPMWLGEVLLCNAMPHKEPVKVSFVLHPYKDLLPAVTMTDGNNRLNANRMLRVRKILAYVAERIDPAGPENPNPEGLRPEEYLELYCNEQLLPIDMSLATMRAHVWKGGNDVVLHYKANGRKEIKPPPPKPPTPEPVVEETRAPSQDGATATATAAA